jgi:MFS family permease
LLALGVVALIAFVLVELRVREPLVDVRLFRIRGVWATNLVGLTFGFGMFGVFLLLPLLLELPAATGYGFGKSVSTAGLFLLPMVAMMMVFGPLSGLLSRRLGPKPPLALGSLAVMVAFLLPAFGHGAIWQLIVTVLLTGAGMGLAFAAMSNAIIESVPVTQTGEATSVNSIVRSIGGSVGTAVVAAVIANGTPAHGAPSDHAFTVGFWVCAAISVLAVIASVAVPGRRQQD